MQVLLLNGSPHADGNTSRALAEVDRILQEADVQTEIIQVGHLAVRGCIACYACAKDGQCIFKDIVNKLAPKFQQADGLVVASPVYYASPNATLSAVLDRLFFSTRFDKTMKVGAAIAVARRGGLSAAFDQLNKYFTISGMPVVSSQYWNSIHGQKPGEVEKDEEGMQIMRTLAHNMVFLMKAIALGKEKYGLPEREPYSQTNFVR
ncbi:MAG: flavodoxin family protein [Elusimicrobiaceae bacterium]|nr:flavodoxin family protein [Elusimicrobiaceae bacterium]